MVILPQELVVRHVSTPSDFAEVIKWQCDIDTSQQLLRATELRLAGNALATDGDLEGAIAKYKEALALNPLQGAHLIHSNLSAAYLQRDCKEAALHHAQQAVSCAPTGFHMAHVRLIDAFYAVGRYAEAAQALDTATSIDPGFKSIPEYKMICRALQDALKKKQRVGRR
eukprot:jgi/Chrzof1/11260/Cz05g29230.t1